MPSISNIVTFGCRLNSYESAIIGEIIKKASISGDIVVINSCAVTNDAELELQKFIKKLNNDGKKIILTGCASELSTEFYANLPGVIKIISNKVKSNLNSYTSKEKIVRNIDKSIIDDDSEFFSTMLNHIKNSRIFIKIQDGCNHDCTFCATTLARGASVSSTPTSIIEKIKKAVEFGFKEVVLTGVDVSDYGNDLNIKMNLTDLLKCILESVPNLERLRLSSLDVAELGDDFIELFGSEKRIMPHLHISLQSGDDIILKRMKRRHSTDSFIRFVNNIRSVRSDVVFGADIIVGFPTENNQMFENSLRIIEDSNISYIHSFAYSKRNGTKAILMPQVEQSEIKKRSKIIHELAKKQLNLLYKAHLNKSHTILTEGNSTGRKENFALFKIVNRKTVESKKYIQVYGYEIKDSAILAHAI